MKKKRNRRKLLQSIDVGGLNFKVYAGTDNDMMDTGWGYVDFSNQEIVIDRRVPPQMRKFVLFHELIHAACEAVSAKKSLNSEMFARPFSRVLLGALKSAKLMR